MAWNSVPNPGDDVRVFNEPPIDAPELAGNSTWQDGDCGVEMVAGGGIDNVWPLGPPASSAPAPYLA